jgi:membrane protease YdiL (CAAX protease family)
MTTNKQFPYTLFQTILLIISGLVIIAPLVLLEKPLNQFISGKTFNILLGTIGIMLIWGVACFINWKKGNKVSYSFNVHHNSTLLLYSIFIIIAFQIGINPFIGYSSILFGLIHALPVAVVGALLIGLYLGWIYFKTRSIGITILLHITANLTGLVVGYSRYRLTDRLEWFNIYGKHSLLFIIGCSILCIIFLLQVLKNTGKEKTALA